MNTSRMTRPAILAATGLTLVLAGCGGSDSSSSSGSGSSSSSKKASAPSAGGYGSSGSTTSSNASATSGGAGTVKLTADPNGGLKFTKTHATAKAGTVSLVMSNPGSTGEGHGIGIEGKGVDKDGPVVGPGKVSKISVKLKPGTYEFYCPIPAHKMAGMKGTLVVQ
jgi:uncharacterized cupredoxin-like copper-binding protein